MKKILAATAIALTMVTASAHAGMPNGLALNGVQTNGLTSNGLTQNGLWSNGLTGNGLTGNGLLLNGRTWTGVRPDASAGAQAIGSTNLIAIELPR